MNSLVCVVPSSPLSPSCGNFTIVQTEALCTHATDVRDMSSKPDGTALSAMTLISVALVTGWRTIRIVWKSQATSLVQGMLMSVQEPRVQQVENMVPLAVLSPLLVKRERNQSRGASSPWFMLVSARMPIVAFLLVTR